MNGFLIGAAFGFVVWIAIGMILGEIAIRNGTTDEFRKWMDSSPRIMGISALGWLQFFMILIGGIVGAFTPWPPA